MPSDTPAYADVVKHAQALMERAGAYIDSGELDPMELLDAIFEGIGVDSDALPPFAKAYIGQMLSNNATP